MPNASFFIVTNGRISYRPRMTPRVPWNPLEVMQLLLAWIFALMLGQLAFNILLPPKIEGQQTVKDGNQTLTVEFLDSARYTHVEHNGTTSFKAKPQCSTATRSRCLPKRARKSR